MSQGDYIDGGPIMPESGVEPVPAPVGAKNRDLRKTALHPDFWHPVARSKSLKRGKTLGVHFAGEPIVLVRPEQGPVFALEDRCAHRQVPLHAGVVCPQGLQCCYHGWTYDAAGRCVSVPYLGKDKTKPNGVRSYPCREAYGLIFVFPGDPALAASTPFPDVPSFADPHYKTRYLDRRVECHYSFMHENLIDMNHQFLHRRLMGRIQTRFLALRREHGRVEVDYTFSRVGGGQHLARVADDVLVVQEPRPHVRVDAPHPDVPQLRQLALRAAQFLFVDAELPGLAAHGQPGPLGAEGGVHPQHDRNPAPVLGRQPVQLP